VIKVALTKDSIARHSEDWEHSTIPALHLEYACLDVYVLKEIYVKPSTMPESQRPASGTPGKTPVTLLSGDGVYPIAWGIIKDQQPTSHGGIIVKTSNNSRVLITVTTVFHGDAGALLYVPSKAAGNIAGLTEKQRKSAMKLLCEFGSPPFDLVTPYVTLKNGHIKPSLPFASNAECAAQAAQSIVEAQELDKQNAGDAEDLHVGKNSDGDDEIDGFSTFLAQDFSEEMGTTEEHAMDLLCGAISEESSAISVNQTATQMAEPTIYANYTRIKKDIFHAMNMIKVPKRHGLRHIFYVRMRDTMFQWEQHTFEKLSHKCKEIFKIPIETMLLQNFRWVVKRCPRIVGDPEKLGTNLEKLFLEL
jgi:hypothetical protein